MSAGEDTWHAPVMVEEARRYLVRASTGLVIDMTVGTGGHSLEMMKSAPASCRLIGLDLDPEALAIARERLRGYEDRVTLVKANFADVMDVVAADVRGHADAVLIDCGISRLEIVTSRRGFSFDRDDALDMRFDPTRGDSARDYLGRATVEEMTGLFRQYGELSHARRIARSIAARMERGDMESTADLAGAVKSVVRAKQARSMARVFLAVRSVVNKEIANLTRAIDALPELLAAGGRACVISYHSVEDRVVKTLFNKHSGKCVCPPCSEVCSCGKMQVFKILTRKPLVPTAEEVAGNPSARSAKLRVAEKM